MDLTEQHINFELDARIMFIGQTIRGVVYGELEYIDEEGNNVDPEPYFKTKYPDLDTLDYSVYFKTDFKTIYVTWDNAFVSYGLSSKYKDLNDNSGTYVQKWDVSNEPKWRDLVGQKIVDFNVYWSEIWTSNPDGNYKISIPYPQSFIITTEGKNKIIISAAELKQEEENEVFGLMDNLLVTTNAELARQLKLIE